MNGLSRSLPWLSVGKLLSRNRIYKKYGKRALDLALVVAAAPIAGPLIAVLAIMVARDGHTPFYSQIRVGRGGLPFRMWKLRTMVPQAERALSEHLVRCPTAAAEWARTQKLTHDPRVTPLGRHLRALSLDELPQLWNVLRGEMSLVGPRPMLPEQEHLYPGHAYYRLRPGLTGPWQVAERHRSAFSNRAGYDTAYHRGLSLGKDLAILVQTCATVRRGNGC